MSVLSCLWEKPGVEEIAVSEMSQNRTWGFKRKRGKKSGRVTNMK